MERSMIIPVRLGQESYDVTLERGALKRAGELINLNRRVLVVTDTGVPEEYADTVAAQCKTAIKVALPSGESSKSMESFEKLLKTMLTNGFTRDDCVVAVGGGVVGDLAGFVSSCYMRGIDFYNIPTTLLSQLDSSIGGKTAIDFCGVKNAVGSFCQPKGVIIDTCTLETLDRRQFFSGLVEAIKMAASFDAQLFELIENSENVYSDIEEIIRRSLCIKRDVVEKDPKERHLRKVLNFGHTVGHAIESESGRLLHGECVGMGMLPMSSEGVRERILSLLKKYGLPFEIPYPWEKLRYYITHDKKMKENTVSAVFCEEIGSYCIKDVPLDSIGGAVDSLIG